MKPLPATIQGVPGSTSGIERIAPGWKAKQEMEQQSMNTAVNTKQPNNDVQLIDAARRGCHDSFAQLMTHYYGQIERYFMRHVRERTLAEDLTQETFIDAFRRLDRFAPDRPFAAWLYRIAHFNLLHAWRQQRSRHAQSLDRMLELQGDSVTGLHQSDSVDQTHERELIARSLQVLSPTLREALVLQSVYGLTGEEIARLLGVQPAAVRQRVARAKHQFRQQYQHAAHA
jgi:RNA polymerase sigma-70 factor, ECF subfamily